MGRGLQKWKKFINNRYNMVSEYKDIETFHKLYKHENNTGIWID